MPVIPTNKKEMIVDIDLIEVQMKLSHAILDALLKLSDEDQIQVVKDMNAGLDCIVVRGE